jgi:hypothetical protein
MYFQNYTPPQTHLAPAETNPAFGAYELRGVDGVVDEAAMGVATSVIGLGVVAAPLMIGWGVHKRGHGAGWTIAAMAGAYFLGIVPVAIGGLVGYYVVGGISGSKTVAEVAGAAGVAAFPAAAAYYAFKDLPMPLPYIPQTPQEGAFWTGGGFPLSTSPAAAHAMLHPGRVGEARWSAVDYMNKMGGRNNPYYLMQRYWPAGADQAQALQGLGAEPNTGLLAVVGGLVVGALIVGVGVSSAAGYYAGKALAPTDEQARTYGGIGVLVGLASAFSPDPISVAAGLGAMAAVTHHLQNRD